MSDIQMSLQSHSPKLYQYMTDKFEQDFHIHSYDLQLNAEKQEKGLHIVVKFGERFDEKAERFFSYDSLEKKDEELTEFMKETGEACKKVLIEDYFKTMTP